MKRISLAGLCLVAVFAMSAVIAASASAAAPEYMLCGKAAKSGKLYIGKYSSKTCGKEASGAEITEGKKNKYERVPWAKKEKYTAANPKGVNPKNEGINPEKGGEVALTVECTEEKVKGEITGPKTAKWKTEFKGCTADKVLKCKNETPKAKEGVIDTEELESTLVFLNAAKTKVGIRVKGATAPEHVLAKYECGAPGDLDVTAVGEVMAQVKGDIGEEGANKDTVDTTTSGALNGQLPYYEEEKQGGGEGESVYAFEWFGEYVGFLEGGSPPSKEAPVTILSEFHQTVAEGPENGVGPATQVSTTDVKGTAYVISTG